MNKINYLYFLFVVALVFSIFAIMRYLEIIGFKDVFLTYYKYFSHRALSKATFPHFFFHIPSGALALTSGCLMFLISPTHWWHKFFGFIYILSSLVASIAAILIAADFNIDPIVVSAYGAGAALWLYFVIKLSISVILGNRSEHIRYAILSYAFTLLFVTARIALYIPKNYIDTRNVDTFPIIYGAIIWCLFWIHLLVGEILASRYPQRTSPTGRHGPLWSRKIQAVNR